jgi:hypothetical protein
MHEVEVLVLDAEAREDQVAEFYVGGEQFAMSLLRDGELVLEFIPTAVRTEPLTVGAHSLALALEKARDLLS